MQPQGVCPALPPGGVPVSLLQTHFPSSVCACFSPPCAQPDSTIRFHPSQAIWHMSQEHGLWNPERQGCINHMGFGTHQFCHLGQVTAPWEPQFPSLINKDHKSTELLSCSGNVPSVPAPPCSKGPGGITSTRSRDMWGNRK